MKSEGEDTAEVSFPGVRQSEVGKHFQVEQLVVPHILIGRNK